MARGVESAKMCMCLWGGIVNSGWGFTSVRKRPVIDSSRGFLEKFSLFSNRSEALIGVMKII